MSEADALARDPGAIKVPGSEEVRELPETQAERDTMPLQYRAERTRHTDCHRTPASAVLTVALPGAMSAMRGSTTASAGNH
jgi:hypothetical protein